MNSKQLLRLAIAVVVIVATAFVLHWWSNRPETKKHYQTGDEVLPDFPVNEVSEIIIKSSNTKVELAKKKQKWEVLDRYGYPADFEQLRNFMVNLSTLTIAHNIAAAPEQYGRLLLEVPQADKPNASGGVQVIFKNESGQQLSEVVMGKMHQQKMPTGGPSWPDGRYIRVVHEQSDDLTALVIETFRNIVPDPSEWLDDEFVAVENIVEMTLKEGGQLKWRLVRKNTDAELQLEGFKPSDTKEADANAIRSAASAFQHASFEDIADPETPDAETGLDNPLIVTAQTTQGMLYTFKIGKQNEAGNYYLRIHVNFVPSPDESKKAENLEKTGANNEDSGKNADQQSKGLTPGELRQKAKELNAKFSPWIYLVPEYTVKKVNKRHSDFIKVKEQRENADNKAENNN